MSSPEKIAERLITLYEKHNESPSPVSAYSEMRSTRFGAGLCAVGIVGLENGYTNECTEGSGRSPYLLFADEFPQIEAHSFAAAFDYGLDDALNSGQWFNNTEPSSRQLATGGYEVGKAVGEWWKMKKELEGFESAEGELYDRKRSPAIISG